MCLSRFVVLIVGSPTSRINVSWELRRNADSGLCYKPLGLKRICISNKFLCNADDADLGTTAGSLALRATALVWYLSHRVLAQIALSPLPGPGQLLLWVCPPKGVSHR